MGTTVTLSGLTGDPMLYRDFPRASDAQAWANWALDTLPCTVRITHDGNTASNDNGCHGHRDDTLAVV